MQKGIGFYVAFMHFLYVYIGQAHGSCQSCDAPNQTAIANIPFTIHIEHALECALYHYEYENLKTGDHFNTTWIMQHADTGEIVFDETYHETYYKNYSYEDDDFLYVLYSDYQKKHTIEEPGIYNVTAEIRTTHFCIVYDIKLTVEEPADSCLESQRKVGVAEDCFEKGSSISIYFTGDGEENYIPPLFNKTHPSYKAYWVKNCGRAEVPDNSSQEEPSWIKLYNPDYADIGIYSYVVEYKGQTIYFYHFNMSLREPISSPEISVLAGSPGHNITKWSKTNLTYVAKLGGTPLDHDVTLTLMKEYENGGFTDICVIRGLNSTLNKTSQIMCQTVSQSRNESFCHNTPVTLDLFSKKIFLHITFLNFLEKNTGNYRIKMTVLSTIERTYDFKVDIQVNNRLTIIIAVCVTVGILAIIIGVVIFRTHICWMWKHYISPIENVDAKHAAMMVYHFDPSDNGTNIAPALTEVRRVVENDLHGSVFDSNKDGLGGSNQGEILQNNLENCSRVIVFLTGKFLRDDWENLRMYEAFRNQKNVIMVKFPGTEAAIRELKEEPANIIKQLMKLSTVLDWGSKHMTKTFKMKLEIAMPKLAPGEAKLEAAVVYENDHVYATINNNHENGYYEKPLTNAM